MIKNNQINNILNKMTDHSETLKRYIEKILKENEELKKEINNLQQTHCERCSHVKDVETTYKYENSQQKETIKTNYQNFDKIFKALGFGDDDSVSVDDAIKKIENSKSNLILYFDSLLEIQEVVNKDTKSTGLYDFCTIDDIKQLKEKADKWDNLHDFPKAVDGLIKGNIKSITFKNIMIENKYDNLNIHDVKRNTSLNCDGLSLDFNNYNIKNKKEIEKEDYTLKFDYDKFENLYYCGCELKNYQEENNSSYNNYSENINNEFFSNLKFETKEFIFDWRIFKDNKQLTKDEIDLILNDVKVFHVQDNLNDRCEINQDWRIGSVGCGSDCTNFIKIEDDKVQCKGLELGE